MAIETTVPSFETDRRTALTDKGVAVLHAYRMLAALHDLGAEERIDVLELLELELAELTA